MLIATPLTYDGVVFDAAGRAHDGRVRITANGAGQTPKDIRTAYRRLLARMHDSGRAYELVTCTSKELKP